MSITRSFLLTCIITSFYSCSVEVAQSDWINVRGDDLQVHVDTLVSPTDTSVMIGEISGFAKNGQHFFVSDNMGMRIHMFSLQGEFVKSLGKRGRGPGEFLNMSAIAWFPLREELVVYDHMNFRLSRLDKDGNFVGSCSYTPNEVEWPRNLMELNNDSHVAVFLVSKDLETNDGMQVLHEIDTDNCSVLKSSVSMKELDQFKKEPVFFSVFSLFSPGFVQYSGRDIVFKTGIDDGYMYYLDPSDLSIISKSSMGRLEDEEPYYMATMGMERDPRVMAISGRIGAAAVLQFDVIGFGNSSDGLMYQFVQHRPTIDSTKLYLDLLNMNNQTRTRHFLDHTLPVSLDVRRGFVPAIRVIGYHNGNFFVASYYNGHHYLFLIRTTDTT